MIFEKHRNAIRVIEEATGYWAAAAIDEFTERIAVLMEEKKITRSELATRLGCSPAYVTKILRGKDNFTIATMTKLARALGAELRIELRPGATRVADHRHQVPRAPADATAPVRRRPPTPKRGKRSAHRG